MRAGERGEALLQGDQQGTVGRHHANRRITRTEVQSAMHVEWPKVSAVSAGPYCSDC